MENLLKIKEHPNYENAFEAHFCEDNAIGYHSHDDFYEMFITLKPQIKHEFNKKEQTLKEKTACFLKPHDAHKITYFGKDDGFHHFNIAFSTDYFERVVSAVSPSVLGLIKESDDIVSISLKDEEFEYLLSLAKELTLSPVLMQRQTIAKLLLINLTALTETRYQKSSSSKIEGFALDLKRRIDNLEFINKGVNEAYKEYPVSFSGLIKKFKEVTGRTVIEYLTERRVEYAKRLLLSTDYSVLEISAIIGYDSLSHFIKVFRKKVGCPPLKYKKQNEKNN